MVPISSFGDSVVYHGAIYGMKSRQKSKEEVDTKRTTNKLTAIQFTATFQKHREEVLWIIYTKRRRNHLKN